MYCIERCAKTYRFSEAICIFSIVRLTYRIKNCDIKYLDLLLFLFIREISFFSLLDIPILVSLLFSECENIIKSYCVKN